MNTIIEWDKACFLWLNNHLAHRWLDPVFYILNWLGNGWVLAILTGIGLWVCSPQVFKRHWFWMMLAMLLSGLAVVILKDLFNRPRPLATFAPLIASGKVHIHNIGPALKCSSFPSGHTQTAFAVGTYLALIFRRFWWLFIGIASLVGLARIYAGVHYPLDVFCGAIIGSSFSMVMFFGCGSFKTKKFVSNLTEEYSLKPKE